MIATIAKAIATPINAQDNKFIKLFSHLLIFCSAEVILDGIDWTSLIPFFFPKKRLFVFRRGSLG